MIDPVNELQILPPSAGVRQVASPLTSDPNTLDATKKEARRRRDLRRFVPVKTGVLRRASEAGDGPILRFSANIGHVPTKARRTTVTVVSIVGLANLGKARESAPDLLAV